MTVPGLYIACHEPALLAGMPYPRDEPWDALDDLGFRHVVCLTTVQPPYDPFPLSVLHAVALEDRAAGGPPSDPPDEARKIRAAAVVIREQLQQHESVVVHCLAGVGRTGTVLACTLIELGLPSTEAVRLVQASVGWPESDWQAKLVRDYFVQL